MRARMSCPRWRSPALVTAVAWCTGRHRLVRRDLAGGGAAGSGALGLAPRGGARPRLFALAGAGLLLAGGALDLLPPPPSIAAEHGALAALGIISAALYATGLALGAEQLARTGDGLLHAEEDRYRLLARNMTDVITRHGRNGAVLFVSPAAEPLFGVRAVDLTATACSSACMSPTGRPISPRSPTPPRSARTARSNSASAAAAMRRAGGQFVWVEMRCRPLDRRRRRRARWWRCCAT